VRHGSLYLQEAPFGDLVFVFFLVILSLTLTLRHGDAIVELSTEYSSSHWALPIAHEQTLAIREKFQKVSWRKRNHKPSTTKVIGRAQESPGR